MPAYISEFYFEGGVATDFIEIRVPVGTDVSAYSVVFYHSDGTVETTLSLGTVVSTNDGGDVYLIDSASPGMVDMKSNEAIALVDNSGTVLQFLTTEGNAVVASGGPAVGMTSTNVGTTSGGQSLQSDDGGSTYYVQTAPNPGTVPCYAPGTMIDTPHGARPVETLKPGDLVLTLDHGAQVVRWTRTSRQMLEQIGTDNKPVLIVKGALGNGLPTQDLVVSPQHRILIGGDMQLSHLSISEAFVPAKSLTKLPGIRHMHGKTAIIWIHFACDRHEVVYANGCLSESLLLGPQVMSGLAGPHRRQLAALFPEVPKEMSLNGPTARRCLTVRDMYQTVELGPLRPV